MSWRCNILDCQSYNLPKEIKTCSEWQYLCIRERNELQSKLDYQDCVRGCKYYQKHRCIDKCQKNK